MSQHPGPSSNPVRIVLCMIVRNEAAVIARCLESALPLVDGYVVCDTGSTDATIAIVEQAAATHEIPGRVVSHPWRNFGHNRTLSAIEARRWVDEAGWPPERTYLLLLDADMVLHADPGFDRADLDADAYDVLQDNGPLAYWNTRLVSLRHDWAAVGATHEYWRAEPDGASTERLESLRIADVGDGGSRGRKFERDIRLLREELARDPQNPRNVFYLAQSYFDIRRWSEAAELYSRRIRMGGWDEERWYAQYRLGLCLLNLRDQRAPGVLLEAYDDRPSRAEPLLALARHYRDQSRNSVALMLAMRGLEVPFPADDVMFVERPVYEWELWEEVMISAYYAGDAYHDLGLDACERLRARRGHDDAFYANVARNEAYYLPTHEATRRGTFTVPATLLEADGVELRATNPTIAHRRGGLRVNIRLVNYRHDAGFNYRSIAPDGIFRTSNAAFNWNPETGRSGPVRIMRDVPDHWPAAWGLGLEDVRWAGVDGRTWLTAACYQVPGSAGLGRVVLGRMNGRLDAVEHLVGLDFEQARDIEKNWLPWAVGGEMRVIYGYDPFLVLDVDVETGATRPRAATTPPFRAADFRGSCPPLPIPGARGRWLALVHEVAANEVGRVYSHRWIELDEERGLVGCSLPFVFDHVGIEYAAGMCDLDGERLIVTYGFEDEEARWAEFRWETVVAAVRAGPVATIGRPWRPVT